MKVVVGRLCESAPNLSPLHRSGLRFKKWPCTSLRQTTSVCAPRLKLQPGTPTAHGTSSLPLLSSDPGGVRKQPLHRTRPSTPPRGLLTHIAASARNSTQL